MNDSHILFSLARASLTFARRDLAAGAKGSAYVQQDCRKSAFHHIADALRLRGYARAQRRVEKARGW